MKQHSFMVKSLRFSVGFYSLKEVWVGGSLRIFSHGLILILKGMGDHQKRKKYIRLKLIYSHLEQTSRNVSTNRFLTVDTQKTDFWRFVHHAK